jgi:uncharacterized membrane protein YhaH (DUF805 family)
MYIILALFRKKSEKKRIKIYTVPGPAKFQVWVQKLALTIKLSQLHKAKTCWTENCWSSGIMRAVLFMFLEAIFFKCFSVCTKKLHKMKLKKYRYMYFFSKFNYEFWKGIVTDGTSPIQYSITYTQSLIHLLIQTQLHIHKISHDLSNAILTLTKSIFWVIFWCRLKVLSDTKNKFGTKPPPTHF